jgi:hypothetical protein
VFWNNLPRDQYHWGGGGGVCCEYGNEIFRVPLKVTRTNEQFLYFQAGQCYVEFVCQWYSLLGKYRIA